MASSGSTNDLPDVLDLTLEVINLYWDDWLTYRALGKRFLPLGGGFRDQPALCMQVILTLDGLFEKILAQNEEEKKEQEDDTE